MEFIDALAIVIDLADENVLEEWQARDNNVLEERERQVEAVNKVTVFLDLIRKDRVSIKVRDI